MPDVLLLLRLAAFWGVSIDELMGYEMYLTTEQIQRIHEELTADFATKEFDVFFLQTIVDLLLGYPEATVDALEDMSAPCRLSVQNEEVLRSAYIELGQQEKGDDFAQIFMYFHILMLICDACRFLVIHRDNLEKCEETKRRVEMLMQLYHFEKINFHFSSLFVYQMAEIYFYHKKTEKAIKQLTKYVEIIERYL